MFSLLNRSTTHNKTSIHKHDTIIIILYFRLMALPTFIQSTLPYQKGISMVIKSKLTDQMRIHIILLKKKKETLSIDHFKGFCLNPLWPQISIIEIGKGIRQECKELSPSLCLTTHIWIISPYLKNYKAMKLRLLGFLICSSNALVGFFLPLSQQSLHFLFSF